MTRVLTLTLALFLTTSCATPLTPSETSSANTSQANMPNPASVYCEELGYRSEIRTAEDGSQSGACIFPDGSECDEWAFYRGECGPAIPNTPIPSPTIKAEMPAPGPTGIPTALPIDPANYQGWWTYTHADYGFSIMLPEDWVVEETTTSDPLMSGHALNLHPRELAPDAASGKENIRISFRRAGEDVRLWPTGVGEGEFVPQGTLDVAGQPAKRVLLVCPSSEVTSIWYQGSAEGQPNIPRDDLEFGFIFSGTPTHCEAGYSLGGKIQRTGEMIIASLEVQEVP